MTANQALARAGLIVSGAFLISRVLGWVRMIVIGNLFPPAELDPFFAAFRIPDLIFQLVAAGALSAALIPVVAGLLASDGSERAWRVVSTIANLMLIALVILAVGMFVFAPVIIPFITPGFDAATTETTVELTRIMLLSPIFLALGAVATSLLNAGGRFGAAAVAPIVYNLAIIGGAILLGPSMGVTGIAIGVVAGAAGHLIVQLPPVRALGFRYRPRIELADALARKALVLMAPRAIGLGATQITFVVVTSLATTLGVGAVTAFTIAFTLLQIPIGVIGVPLGVVLFPSLSREAAMGRDADYVALLTRALRVIVFVMVPIAALTALLRVEWVALLFGHGSFGVAEILRTAQTLLVFALGLVAHSLIAVLARAFYARQDTITPALAAVGAVVVNTLLAIALVGPLGLPGIALAIAIAAWLEAGTLLVILRLRLHALRLATVGRVAVATSISALAASLAALVVGTAVRSALGLDPADPAASASAGFVALLIVVTAVSAAFGAVFVLLASVLRITELPAIVGLMVDAFRRPRRA